MDERDRTLLDRVQAPLPLTARPFAGVAGDVDMSESEIVERLRHLKDRGLIRRFGGVFDAKALGWNSCLAAAAVPGDRLAETNGHINRFPGVIHNYRRDHRFNLCFTLTTSSARVRERILRTIRDRTAVGEVEVFFARRVFRRRVTFALTPQENRERGGAEPAQPARASDAEVQGVGGMTAPERRILACLQGDIPAVVRPFARVGEKAGCPEGDVLAYLERWRQEGFLRRLAVLLRHRRSGFTANAMSVWEVTPERLEDVAGAIVRMAGVGHCYQRAPVPAFPYNLYAMLHGRSRERVREAAGRIRELAGVSGGELLFTLEEYKKTSLDFFAEEIPEEARDD